MGRLLKILPILMLSSPVSAAIVDVESLQIGGGQVVLNGSSSYDLLVGDIGPLQMGTYQGSPACCSPAAAETTLVYYEFGFFGWAGVHTSASDGYSSDIAPPPSGYVDTTNGTIVLDLSAWTWTFNGVSVHQGASNIAGSYDHNTGAFDVSWTSLIENGGFAGNVHDWHLTGTATLAAVPVPAAFWLFGSGLAVVGLFGQSRRKKI